MPRPSVLIVDDDDDLRATVAVRFAAAGFAVLEAATGEEGLALAGRRRPGAIILDVTMPGIDGFETCRRLRADARTAQVPVIMLTACSRVGELEEGLRAGADTYLTKPFDGAELLAEVQAALGGGQRRPRARRPSPARAAGGAESARRRAVEILRRAPRRLGQVARAVPGILLSRRDDRLLAPDRRGEDYRPVLFEEDLESFAARGPARYFKFSPAVARSLAPDASVFEVPRKVLLRRSAPPLVAALDCDRRLADKTVIVVVPREGRTRAEFLLGVLASRLATFAFERAIERVRGGALPWASPAEIERLPLPGAGDLAGRAAEGAIAAVAEDLARRARLGPGARGPAMSALAARLDALVAEGFGLDAQVLKQI